MTIGTASSKLHDFNTVARAGTTLLHFDDRAHPGVD